MLFKVAYGAHLIKVSKVVDYAQRRAPVTNKFGMNRFLTGYRTAPAVSFRGV